MLSKIEKKFLKYPILIKEDNYKYVLTHRINQKILNLEKDLDLFLESGLFHKDWLKGIFENYLSRVDWD